MRITPHLGELQHVTAMMPTPKGRVEVRYTKENGNWVAVITLPKGTSGELSWKDKVLPLRPGEQTIRLDQ